MDIQERVLGKGHSDTTIIYNSIGGIFHSQGDYPKALKYYQKALNIREKVLGKEHPDTAIIYNNIGGIYFCQGEYTKAIEYLKRTIAIVEKVLGPNHPYTKQTKRNMEICQSKCK